MSESIDQQILNVAQALSRPSEAEVRMNLRPTEALPSTEALECLLRLVRSVFFPSFFSEDADIPHMQRYQIGVDVSRIERILRRQVARGFAFSGDKECADARVEHIVLSFLAAMPEIKHMLLTDIEAVAHRDPAVGYYSEVVFSYPVVQVMLHHRVAHKLWQLGVPIIPRIISEMAHSKTGIDIHPAATIGEYFAIDHGTGVVIGETTVIGRHVMLYQGVTLGAKGFKLDADGRPQNVPRHPVLEDNVTVYSNTSILGRVTIGHDSVIGGNVWITTDVPPHSRVLQSKPRSVDTFEAGLGI